MGPSLLAHIVKSYASTQWENIATDSLLYLLERPGVEESLMRLVSRWGLDDERLQWSTQVSNEDRSRPDLVGKDSLGRPKLMVEVKFWATLTDNQPVAYLRNQESAFPGQPEKRLLVFVVPKNRVSTLTTELSRRLLEDGAGRAHFDHSESLLDNRVAIISWADLLREIRVGLTAFEDATGLEDLNQLQGLCDRADSEAMRPLTAEEIDPVHGQRYGDFAAVARRAAEGLLHSGRADGQGLKASNGAWGVGRFMRSPQGATFWFGFYPAYWARHYPSPWWIQFGSGEDARTHQALRNLSGDPRFPFIAPEEGMTIAAVPAPLGVEFEEIVRQVADSVDELLTAMSGARTSVQPER